MDDLRLILRRSRQTALYVTHDQEEAFAIADRIVVLNAGSVEQIGIPQAIYYHPATLFVARFLGMTNFMPGRLLASPDGPLVETEFGSFPLAETDSPGFKPPNAEATGVQPVTVLLRPDALRIDPSLPCQVPATLQELSFRGQIARAVVLANGQELALELPFNDELPPIGAEISIGFDPSRAYHVFF